jgi:hypothetical protein
MSRERVVAPLESWPRIVCERFDGETAEGYGRRSDRIVEIVTDFRMGRYDEESGELLERELTALQDPAKAYDLAAVDKILAKAARGEKVTH